MPRSRDPLAGVRVKLSRAWALNEQLSKEIEAYKDSRPVLLDVSYDGATQRLSLKAKVTRQPPSVWSAQIGEIVHNFRSSLDHVVYELAGRPTRRGSKTQFPIFETEPGFLKRGVTQFLEAVPAPAVEYIRSIQPFAVEGHTNPLWLLMQLNDLDKHRAPRVAMNQLLEYDLTWEVAYPFNVVSQWRKSIGEIRDGDEIYGAVFSGTPTWPFKSKETKGLVAMDVAFEDGCPVRGAWAVRGTIALIGNRVETVLRRLAEDIFHVEL